MSADLALPLALAVPLAAAALVGLAGRRPNLREGLTLAGSGLLAAVVMGSLLPAVLAGERPEWTLLETMPALALRLRLEPLGMIFATVAALLWPVNSLYSVGYMRGNREGHQTRFYVFFALALSAAMGVALAGNLLTLFVFYEALTLSTYPLVTHRGTPEAMRAGRVYLGVLLATSIGLFLLAIAWTWAVAGTLAFAEGGILRGRLGGGAVGVLLALYIFGIGKAALMPLHRWLPAAMVAPVPVSALLHAVAVVKAGVFAIVKVLVYVFGLDLLRSEPSARWLLYVAGFTTITASVIALRTLQRGGNLKRMLAYSTVSQLSYVVLAAAILAPLSAVGAALHIVAHAFGKITLFFAAGSIYTAAGKTEIGELAGIGRRMPWTMGAFAVGALSMIGLPPAAGFVSKWYILLAAFEAEALVAVVVLAASTLLNAAYFVPIVYTAFFADGPARAGAPPASSAAAHGEAPWPIVLATSATAALTLAFFVWPELPLALALQLAGGSG
ncbi:MAG: proton-conducting transporter membrane subunit [Gemmatimonadota bacterium]|nr:proton-conducting transporter membrane subunit [Gemmatimonadota bacterium]